MLKKKLSVIGAIFLFLSAFVELPAQSLTKQADGTLFMENAFVKICVSPEKGGRIINFEDKRNGLDYTSAERDSGIFTDLDWQQIPIYKGDWFCKPYAAEIEQVPGKCSVKLSRTGSEGSMSWITIEKTYTLTEQSPALTIDYSFKINPAAMTDVTACPWLHNGLNVKKERADIYIPTISGVKKIGYNPSAPANESFYYDLSAGWAGIKIPNKNSGIIILSDYRYLMCVYNWQGSSANTIELMFRSQRIPCGKSFATSLTLIPFIDLENIDGASSELVGGFIANDKQFSGVKLYASSKITGTCEISYRKLPNRLFSPIITKNIQIETGKTLKIPFELAPQETGTYVVKCKINNTDGKKTACFESPLIIGHPSETYTVTPAEKRLGSDAERFGKKIFNDTEKQDCYTWNTSLPSSAKPWCKPYSGGTTKLLIVTDMTCGREAIELASLMDAELSTCTFSSCGKYGWSPIWGHNGGKAETNTYLGEVLKKDYDCILLSGIQLQSISPENLEIIAAKVRSGTGLVSVMPSQIPPKYQDLFPARPMIDKSFLKIAQEIIKSNKFKFEHDSFLKGMSLEGYPEIFIFPYEKTDKVKISVSGEPFLCTGSSGKGKTALFSWLTGCPDNTNKAGIAPYFEKETSYPYHELFYAMLIKAIHWAGNHGSDVSIEEITSAPDGMELFVKSTSPVKREVEIEIDIKHESGKCLLSSLKFKKLIEKGSNKISIPMELPLLHGRNFVDVRMKAQGQAVDFGSAVFKKENMADIAEITIPDKIFKEGEIIPVKVKVANGTSSSITGKLIDHSGRLLFSLDAIPDNNGNAVLNFPLKHLYTHCAKIELELKSGGKLLDRRMQEVLLAPASVLNTEWEQFNIMLSWPTRDTHALPFYLHDIRANTLRDMGVTMVMDYGIPVSWGKDKESQYLTYRQGFKLVLESIARLSYRSKLPYVKQEMFDYRSRKDEFRKLQELYNKTNDRKYLERKPTLEDARYRADFREGLTKWLPEINKWHPAVYDLGDEMSYTLYSNQLDFDFSPSSLNSFRNWLKTQYPSLDKLNQEWQRSYKTWEDVTPDTANDARQRKIYSAWADHRTYNEKVFADFFSFVKSIIRETVPNAKIAMSGTQPPTAYGGYDWTLLMPILDTMNAYNRFGLPEIYRSFKKIPLMGWVGYDSSEAELWSLIWNNVFNGHYGVALYNETVILNPDLTLTQRGKWLKEAIMPLRNGIGTLVYNSTLKTPEIAVHYSQSSAHAAWIDQEEDTFSGNRLGWLNLLHGLGLNSQFVPSGEIEKGALRSGQYKALVLPLSIAISDKELEEIRLFTSKGGLLIADKKPGIRNEHCSDAQAGRMKDIFAGKNAVLTGKTLEDYDSNPALNALINKLKTEFSSRGIGKSQKLIELDKKDVKIYSLLLENHGGELVGLLNKNENTCHFNHTPGFHIYDAINGREILSDKIVLPANRPSVFVSLPYQVDGIKIQADKTSSAVKISAQVQASANPGRHVLRFDVRNEKGDKSDLYSAVHEAPEGKAVHEFYPALNDTGTWEVTVTDVISGKNSKIDVKL